MHEKRPKRGDNQKVGQNESPAACPGSPEAAAQIGDEDADLYRKRPRQRLTDGDRLPHQPFAFADKFALHLADKRDGAAKSHESEA